MNNIDVLKICEVHAIPILRISLRSTDTKCNDIQLISISKGGGGYGKTTYHWNLKNMENIVSATLELCGNILIDFKDLSVFLNGHWDPHPEWMNQIIRALFPTLEHILSLYTGPQCPPTTPRGHFHLKSTIYITLKKNNGSSLQIMTNQGVFTISFDFIKRFLKIPRRIIIHGHHPVPLEIGELLMLEDWVEVILINTGLDVLRVMMDNCPYLYVMSVHNSHYSVDLIRHLAFLILSCSNLRFITIVGCPSNYLDALNLIITGSDIIISPQPRPRTLGLDIESEQIIEKMRTEVDFAIFTDLFSEIWDNLVK